MFGALQGRSIVSHRIAHATFKRVEHSRSALDDNPAGQGTLVGDPVGASREGLILQAEAEDQLC